MHQYFIFFFFDHHTSRLAGSWVPNQGWNPSSQPRESIRSNHWTSKEFPVLHVFMTECYSLHGHITFCLIHSSFGFFPAFWLGDMLLWISHARFRVNTYLQFPWVYTWGRMTGLCGKCVNFWRTTKLFSEAAALFTSPPAMYVGSLSSHPCQPPSFCVTRI